MKQNYNVTLGLGRMGSNHTMSYVVMASGEAEAVALAKEMYRSKVAEKIGRENPIWNKVLTVTGVVGV